MIHSPPAIRGVAAGRLFGAAEAWRVASGLALLSVSPTETTRYAAAVRVLHAALSPDELAALWATLAGDADIFHALIDECTLELHTVTYTARLRGDRTCHHRANPLK